MGFFHTIRRNHLFIIALVIIAVLLLVLFGRALEPAANSVGTFFYSYAREWSGRIQSQKSLKALDLENKKLREQLSKINEQLKDLETIKLENERLKSVTQYQRSVLFEQRTARIVGMSQLLDDTSVIIDLGSQQGIQPGYMVVNEYGELLGKVISVEAQHAFVRLMTHPQISFALKKAGTTQLLGITQGDFSVALRLDLIPKEAVLREGDMLVTAPINEQPDNIIVGTVISVTASRGGLFQEAVIRPAFDIHDLLFVNVIIPAFNLESLL